MTKKTETEEHLLKVTVDIKVQLESLHFPTDKNGMLTWTPFQCIEDYISHNLFKEHDASYMTNLGGGLEFEDWRVKFPQDLIVKLTEIMVKNIWEHPEDKRGKSMHEKFNSLEEAITKVTKDTIRTFG